ncbi:MAG: NADH-quinone oxidoreductase subunit M [Myxococcota bacterium]
MLLTVTVFLPLAAALLGLLLPGDDPRLARRYGLCVSLATFAVSLALPAAFDAVSGAMQLEASAPWIRNFGIAYHVGVDGLSLFLVLLTTLLVPICLLSAERAIDRKVKEFVIAMLVLETGMLGAFVALDLFLFFVFWEVMLVPMYLLIGIWGGERREYAAIKFVLYTMVGSVLMLIAILYLHIAHLRVTGERSFELAAFQALVLPPRAQLLCFLAFALAFAIKVPMFPLHTWLPDAHVQAPTAGSVILAGVLLKLGTYGLMRFALPLFPRAAVECGPYLGALAVVGILYGALVALDQRDLKRLVAYSSVSHLGFVVLGLGALTVRGLEGAVFQMLTHGLSTGALFLAVGVIYERRHTREISQLGGLFREMPVFGAFLLIATLASAGLPGLAGFVGEFLILLGTFEAPRLLLGHPKLYAALAAGGVVLGAWYLLVMYQKTMLGPVSNPKNRGLPDLSTRERAVFLPILALIFVMGIYPTPILRRIEPAAQRWLGEFHTKYEASLRLGPGDAPIVIGRDKAGEDRVGNTP